MPVIVEKISNNVDRVWRERCQREEIMAGKTPPKANPFLHSCNGVYLAGRQGEGEVSRSLTRSKSAPKMTASSVMGGPLSAQTWATSKAPPGKARAELFERQKPPAHPYAKQSSSSKSSAAAAPTLPAALPRRTVKLVLPEPPTARADDADSVRDDDDAASAALTSIASRTNRTVESLQFRADDTSSIWRNKLEELALRVELERLERVEKQTEEMVNGKTAANACKNFVRSLPR